MYICLFLVVVFLYICLSLVCSLSYTTGPGEIKRREVVLDPQVSLEEIKSRDVELGLRVGLLLLQLFPNGGATDIVFVTLFCIAVGTAIAWYGGRCAMPDGHCLNILLLWRGPRKPWSSGLAPVSRFHSSVPFSQLSPSLIGLFASVDVKQQSLSLSRSLYICLSLIAVCLYICLPLIVVCLDIHIFINNS